MKDHRDEMLHDVYDTQCKKCIMYNPKLKSNCTVFTAIIKPVLEGRERSAYTEQIARKQFRSGSCRSFEER